MRSFEFHRPQSVADAVALLKGNDSAKLLAGGQSLLPVMKLDLAQPSDLVTLAGIPGLREIRAAGDNLVIGALVTHDEVASSPEVRRRIPALAGLAAGIGDAQVRNRGTIGGSLAHADPAADYPAAVLALGATIVTDRRRIAADDYFTGLFQTALAADEIITAVSFPVPERAAYAKFPSPASKYAVVGVMVAKTAGGVRVAVTGAGSKAFRVPALESALAASFKAEAINPGAVAAADLRSDGDASAEYRAHLVTVMAKRAVQACS
ncbi:MAG TPA: xanthine dehydrogenase family protein subunit M [Thermoanaerobaculia bacterium]|jgi:carbon-monoxide dehydrogenase medium subunit|nr:xanthine dehydrogenase family protein subunit M [Thermoanaerobaculia bacterium]